MAELDNELSAILAGFAKASVGGNTQEEPAAVTGTVAETNTTDTPETPTVSTAPEVKKETPIVEASKEEPSAAADWDATPEKVAEAPVATAPVEIFSELGKVLGMEKVNGKEDILKAIQSLKVEAEKAKAPDKTTTPPELLRAIELSQKGGDWASYLKVTVADYSTADPVQLYEDYVIDQLADANGQVDTDKVNEYLDSVSDTDKMLRGKDLQKRLVFEQTRKIAEIEDQATRVREKIDAELKAAFSGISELDGFKIEDGHRRDAFNWVQTGKIMQDLFYGADGSLDPVKTAKNALRLKNYEKFDAYQKNKIRNATKREILADVTNAQITSPGIAANPTTKKGYDIGDYISQLEQKLVNR